MKPMSSQALSTLNMVLQWIAVIGSICALTSAVGLIFTRTELSSRQTIALNVASADASSARSVAAELKDEVERVKRFSYVASLTFNGSVSVGGEVTLHTPISRAIEGTWYEVGPSTYRPSCEDTAITKSLDAIQSFPEFPFTYYALAICLKQKGDPDWRTYASQAIEILKSTTQISGHQDSHDFCLRKLIGMAKAEE